VIRCCPEPGPTGRSCSRNRNPNNPANPAVDPDQLVQPDFFAGAKFDKFRFVAGKHFINHRPFRQQFLDVADVVDVYELFFLCQFLHFAPKPAVHQFILFFHG
jgi:hypothetical protein